jgi:hypothetical protein
VNVSASLTDDVFGWNSARDQRIRNQGAMAAPGNGFRAHQRDPFFPRKLNEAFETLVEFRALYMIRESAE